MSVGTLQTSPIFAYSSLANECFVPILDDLLYILNKRQSTISYDCVCFSKSCYHNSDNQAFYMSQMVYVSKMF